jgi:hypothetical protein
LNVKAMQPPKRICQRDGVNEDVSLLDITPEEFVPCGVGEAPAKEASG